jgi:hypothetical protein
MGWAMAALSGDRDDDEWDEYRLIRSAHRPPRLRRLRGHHLRAVTAILLSTRDLLPVGGGGGGEEVKDDSASRGEQVERGERGRYGEGGGRRLSDLGGRRLSCMYHRLGRVESNSFCPEVRV